MHTLLDDVVFYCNCLEITFKCRFTPNCKPDCTGTHFAFLCDSSWWNFQPIYLNGLKLHWSTPKVVHAPLLKTYCTWIVLQYVIQCKQLQCICDLHLGCR